MSRTNREDWSDPGPDWKPGNGCRSTAAGIVLVVALTAAFFALGLMTP